MPDLKFAPNAAALQHRAMEQMKKVRETTEQTQETAVANLTEEVKAVDIGVDETAMIHFDDHATACSVLQHIGYVGADRAPKFKVEELVLMVNEQLQGSGVVLLDMTSSIPNTATAAYQALTIAAFTAEASCRKDQNAAFLIMRTAANTPSFLFGHHWNLVQSLGKEVANEHVSKQPVPAAFVCYRERQLCMPSLICDADATLAARLLASEIVQKPELFCCKLCGGGFVKHDDAGNIVAIDEVALTKDGRTYKRPCAEAHNARMPR